MIKFDPNRKIHEQITEETWSKGSRYYTEYRYPTNRTDMACSACLLGWVEAVYPDNIPEILNKLAETINPGNYQTSSAVVFCWNDRPSTQYSDIINLCKEADV